MKCLISLTTLLLSGPLRLCVRLSFIPLLLISSLESFSPVHPCLFVFDTRTPPPPIVSPSGAVDKGGQGGAGPSPGASDSGGGACSGTGAGPSRSDSIRSMVSGGTKAGRWQMVQSHLHAGGLRLSK